MKIKRSQLKQIIKEEVKRVLNEQGEQTNWTRQTDEEWLQGHQTPHWGETLPGDDRPQSVYYVDPEDRDTPEYQEFYRQSQEDTALPGGVAPQPRPAEYWRGPRVGSRSPEPTALEHIPSRDCPPGGCPETNIPYPPPPEREGR